MTIVLTNEMLIYYYEDFHLLKWIIPDSSEDSYGIAVNLTIETYSVPDLILVYFLKI